MWHWRRILWSATALSLFLAVGVYTLGLPRFVTRRILRAAKYFSVLSPPESLSDSSQETFFKYGSIGTEAEGMPYEIWKALPQVCPRPDATDGTPFQTDDEFYAYLGLTKRESPDFPIGFSRRTVSLLFISTRRVGFNCALCHTATYRTDPDAERKVVLGGPTHRFDSQRYIDFLVACVKDPKSFTADKIFAALEQQDIHLGLLKRLLYRLLLVRLTRLGVLETGREFAFRKKQPPWGPGRFDAINGSKSRVLEMPSDGTIGVTDIPPAWLLNPAHARNWDGNHTSLTEAIRSEALATGTRKKDLGNTRPIDNDLMRLKEYLQGLRPPSSPFMPAGMDKVDCQQEENRQIPFCQGKDIFIQCCAECHASEKNGRPTRLGMVIPLEEVGTDPYRLRAWTPAAVKEKNKLGKGYDWQISQARKTNGYVAVPLDGIWLRAPYLHNGSVPTLCDLLQPPEQRPIAFYRGYDVLDANNVGFIANVPEERGRKFFPFDTRQIGNGNGGHRYGTDLSRPEKDALLKYLQTR